MRSRVMVATAGISMLVGGGVLGSTALTRPAEAASSSPISVGSGTVIEAEDFVKDGEGVGSHDSSRGNYFVSDPKAAYADTDVDVERSRAVSSRNQNYDIGNTGAGEWLRYDITVDTPGDYDISARVASVNKTGRFAYTLDSRADDHQLGSTVAVPNTNGWQTWISQSQTVHINTAGTHQLYVLVKDGGFNLDRMTIVPKGRGWARTVGLGSSYAAGPGVDPFTDPNSRGFVKSGVDADPTKQGNTCERSQKNQVNILAGLLQQKDAFYDVACPGDVSPSIAGADGSQGDQIAEAASGYRSSAPGAGALGTGTTLVTLAVGGNDHYPATSNASVTGKMIGCAKKDCVDSSGNPVAGELKASDITVARMTANLRPIVDLIHAKAPNARIRFISYPSVFGRGTVSCAASDRSWAYSAAEGTYLQGVLNRLSDTEQTVLSTIAADKKMSHDQLQIVDIRKQSEAHNICASKDQRWIAQPAGDTGAATVHPKQEMFAMEANAVKASL